MRTPILRCPFPGRRGSISGAGLILVLALSACASLSACAAPAAETAPAAPAASPAAATSQLGAARPAPARQVHSGQARTARATGAARTAALAGTSKTARRSPAAVRDSASTSPPVPTSADLQAALLTTADVPAGYNVQPANSALLGASSLSGCSQLTSTPAGVIAQASVTLAGPAKAPSVSETLMQVRQGDAAAAMARYAAMATDCSQFTGSVGRYHVSFTASPLAVPALGDQRSAVAITGFIAAAKASVYVDFIAIRHDSTLIVVIGASVSPSPAFTEQAASTAYARVPASW